MGKWSECSACKVFHVVCLLSVFEMVVMSGDVDCWSAWGGFRVCSLVLSVMCVEFCMRSAMSVPLWSSVGECQSVECALMSPAMREFSSVVR